MPSELGTFMNILFVINKLIFGGAERYVNLLANSLAEEGNNVFVISSGGPTVKHLNRKITHKKIDSIPGTSKQEQGLTSKAIEVICKENKIDLVHCNSVTAFRAAFIAKKITGVPIIYTAHATEQSMLPVIGSEIDKKVDKVIAVSNFIKLHLKRTGLVNGKNALVLHGIDTNKFKERFLEPTKKTSLGIKNGERVIMTVARLNPEKGIDTLIKAIPIIKRNGNNIKLVLVGDGPQRANYEKLTEDLGIKDTVLFLGGRGNVAELLSITDIFCLPSIREALSFAILEAMAEGKPVVATKVGGIPEAVIDGETGLLVPAANINRLASALNLLLENKDISRKFSSNAKQRVKKYFNFERMFKETKETYQKVLEEERVYA